MKIALFSDVHGHLRPLLRVMQCWQMAHETFLDAALVAGDLGCFPATDHLDIATQRHMKSNPEEAGFSRFFVRPRPEISALFEASETNPHSRLKCAVFFVAGNHEDFDFLHQRNQQSPAGEPFVVDCYNRIHCVRDGSALPARRSSRGGFKGGWPLGDCPWQTGKTLLDTGRSSISADGIRGERV